jgi:hypothetical protein
MQRLQKKSSNSVPRARVVKVWNAIKRFYLLLLKVPGSLGGVSCDRCSKECTAESFLMDDTVLYEKNTNSTGNIDTKLPTWHTQYLCLLHTLLYPTHIMTLPMSTHTHTHTHTHTFIYFYFLGRRTFVLSASQLRGATTSSHSVVWMDSRSHCILICIKMTRSLINYDTNYATAVWVIL